CIENEYTVATANFDARRVAAIPDCRWTWARDTSSDAPESNAHGSFQHSALPENLSNRFYLEWSAMSTADGQGQVGRADTGDPASVCSREIIWRTCFAGKEQSVINRGG